MAETDLVASHTQVFLNKLCTATVLFCVTSPTILSHLQDYLVKWPKTLMVVSHARDFLNMVCTDILHLHSRKLTSYKGDFDTFERTATERLRNAKKAAEGQERQRAHMQVCLGSRVEF